MGTGICGLWTSREPYWALQMSRRRRNGSLSGPFGLFANKCTTVDRSGVPVCPLIASAYIYYTGEGRLTYFGHNKPSFHPICTGMCQRGLDGDVTLPTSMTWSWIRLIWVVWELDLMWHQKRLDIEKQCRWRTCGRYVEKDYSRLRVRAGGKECE